MNLRFFKAALAVGVTMIAVGLYWKTMAPTATLVDSGELITACARLDMGHPPGFPLYILVGWLFSHWPWGSVATRLNFMSALFGAVAAGAVFYLAAYTLELKPAPARRAMSKALRKIHKGSVDPLAHPKNQSRPGSPLWEVAWPAAVAALTLVGSNTLWSYSTVTEVYTLNTFLLALILCFVLRCWGDPNPGEEARYGYTLARRLFLAALVFGLALGVHHVSVAFLAAGILYLLITQRRYLLKPVVVLKSAGWLLLGSLVYLYLPLRAAQKPLLNWGNPNTFERVIWHITGKQYRVNLVSTSLERAMERLVSFFQLWMAEFTWVGFILIGIGLVILWRSQRRLFWFVMLIMLFNLAWTTFYDIAEDNEAYGLPIFVLSAIGLAWGLRWLVREVTHRWTISAPVVSLLLLLLPAATIALHYTRNDHSRYYVAYDYVHNALDNVEANALLLTLDWHLYSPMLYYQHVEKLRPDVAVIDVNLLRRSWYMNYLRRQYPWLIEAAADDVQAYLADLDRFEHDQPYNPNSIQTKFLDMINHFIRIGMMSRPVYTTLSVQSEPQIAHRLFWVPQGVVFRLYRLKPEFVAPGEHQKLRRRGLTDGAAPLDDVAQRIRSDYARMITNRGIYLTLYDRHEEALAYYKQAWSVDPRVLDTPWKMALSYKALGRPNEAREAYQAALSLDPDNRNLQAEYRALK
ncbi:MAG: DUF2723 domain-containing protein [Acidobacteria bacterium]|nr:DUF2723 domain-containing protein [Acidobacteriota bacterium]MBI3658763.1 DUF2723 domain-containing protein [Acidobacteriota bacterium]